MTTVFSNEINELQRKLDDDSRYRMEKLHTQAEDIDKKSVDNFSRWRDYLYKYYTLVLALITGTGILKQGTFKDQQLLFGITIALGGLLIGFTIINIYFYLERRWQQAQHYLTTSNPYKLYDHPDSGGDIRKAIVLNLKVKINEYKLKKIDFVKKGDFIEAKRMENQIKADLKMISLMKYVGEQYGFIERIWLYGVVSSMLFTFIGVVLIFLSFLKS